MRIVGLLLQMHLALCEAMRNVSLEDGVAVEEPVAVSRIKATQSLSTVYTEQWLILPRKFTRQNARFELPIDSSQLSRMCILSDKYICIYYIGNVEFRIKVIYPFTVPGLSPLQYLARFVQISNCRKQLYHRIFVKFIAELVPNDITEEVFSYPRTEFASTSGTELSQHPSPWELYLNGRCIPSSNLIEALSIVLYPTATVDTIENILDLVLDDENDERQCDIKESAIFQGNQSQNNLRKQSLHINGTASLSASKANLFHNMEPTKNCMNVNRCYESKQLGHPSSMAAEHIEFSKCNNEINFRTWCGIVAFAERFVTTVQQENDTRHEVTN